VEPEDLDAVLEGSGPASPADVGTAHMEAPIDREVLARLLGRIREELERVARVLEAEASGFR
jgi:hypothetical protein